MIVKKCRKGIHQYEDNLKRCPYCSKVSKKNRRLNNLLQYREKELARSKKSKAKNYDKSKSSARAQSLKVTENITRSFVCRCRELNVLHLTNELYEAIKSQMLVKRLVKELKK